MCACMLKNPIFFMHTILTVSTYACIAYENCQCMFCLILYTEICDWCDCYGCSYEGAKQRGRQDGEGRPLRGEENQSQATTAQWQVSNTWRYTSECRITFCCEIRVLIPFIVFGFRTLDLCILLHLTAILTTMHCRWGALQKLKASKEQSLGQAQR